MMIGKMFGKSPDVEDFNGIDLKEKERWKIKIAPRWRVKL